MSAAERFQFHISDPERRRHFLAGLAELPALPAFTISGRNGEELATDEAAVWKRVLSLRLTRWLQPNVIVESHPGLGIGSAIYLHAAPQAAVLDLDEALAGHVRAGILDIDPFGQPWDTLRDSAPLLHDQLVLFVSNGEAHAVRRNVRRGQRFPTTYYGRRMHLWVEREFIPRVEELTGLQRRFFYAFPTTVRAVFSSLHLTGSLWHGCPQWMWWLGKHLIK
jgi:hypothetical protein